MSEDLILLEKWSNCGFFKDTTDLNTELLIAKLAEDIMNISFLEVDGLNVEPLVMVSSIKLLKETNSLPDPKNIYDELINYNQENNYNEQIKNEWVSNFLNYYKTKNNILN
jgi:hypothetical protein